MAITTTQQQDAYRFFVIAFGAAPGVTYMNQIAEAYAAGMDTKAVVNAFVTKDVFKTQYPIFLTNEQFAASLVANVVGTAASATAKAEAESQIVAALAGGMGRGEVIYNIFNNLANKPATDADWGTMSTKLANQVAYAKYYTETLRGDTTTVATLQAVVSNVTATSDVTAAGIAAVLNPSVAPVSPTFTLTTSARDVYNGTAGDNSVEGVFSTDETKNTADATDTIFDATTTDNDTATFVTNQDVTDVPKITNIENLVFNIDATTTGGDSEFEVDLTNASGVKSVSINVVRTLSGVNSATLTEVGDGVTVNTDNRITTIDITSTDGGDQNVNAAAVGSAGAPVSVTIATGGADTGDNVITAAGHVDVTTDALGAVTVTAMNSAVVDAAGAAIVIANAKDGDLTADASDAVIAQLTATGDIEVTDGGDGSLTVKSTAGDVEVVATESSKTVIEADGDVTLDGTNTGEMTITAGGDVDVTGTTADDVSVTSGGAVGFVGTVGDGKLTIVAAEEVTLDSVHTTVNVTAVGDSTLDIDDAKTLSVSGNGDDAEFEITDMAALSRINVSGADDVTLLVDAADRTGEALTIKDTSTGSLSVELTSAGSVDLRGSDLLDSLILSDDFANETLSVRSGQSISIETSQGAAADFEVGAASSVAKNSVTLVLDDGARDASVVDLGGTTVTNARTISIVASADAKTGGVANPSTITSFDASAAKANVTVDAGANGVTFDTAFDVSSSGSLTVKSSGAVDLTGVTLTAGTFDASAVTGKVTATTLTSAAQIVKTGSASDALTYTGAGSITVESGAGNDTVQLDDATYSGFSTSINLGDGTADTLVLDGAGTLLIAGSTGKVTLAGVEVIRVTTGTSAQIDASLLSGQTYIMQGGSGTASANPTLGAKVSSSATSLDFTKLVASTDVATKFTGSTLAVDASANTAAITILGMTKVANSITGSAAKGDSLVGGELNDTFTYSNSNLLFADKAMLDTIVGGAGNADILAVTAGNIASTDSFANLSGVENFSGAGTSLVFGATAETAGLKSFSVAMASNTTISTAAYTTTATTITASGTANATITLGAAGGTVTATGAGNHKVTGGAGADKVTVGDGDNVVSVGDGANTVTAGDGANTITAGNGGNTITAGDGGNTITSGSGVDGITSGDADDLINSGDGNDVIFSGEGVDTIDAGAGDDVIQVYFSDNSDDTLTTISDADGGTGTDTLQIFGVADSDGVVDAMTLADADLANFSSIEVLTVSAASGDVISITLAANAEAAGIREVDLSADTDEEGANVVDFSAYAADVTVIGGSGSDDISGGAGSLYVRAGGGDDTITMASDSDDIGDVIILESSASANGQDSIVAFQVSDGSGDPVDTIDFSAFLSNPAIIGNSIGSEEITPVSEGDSDDVVLNGRVAVIDDSANQTVSDAGDVLALINGEGNEFSWSSSGKAVLFIYDGTDTTVWYLNSALTGSSSVLSVDDIKLVATIVGVDGTSLMTSNIGLGG